MLRHCHLRYILQRCSRAPPPQPLRSQAEHPRRAAGSHMHRQPGPQRCTWLAFQVVSSKVSLASNHCTALTPSPPVLFPKLRHLSLLLPFRSPWPAEAPQVQAVGDIVGNVVQVQHGGRAEDVHFRLLLLLPSRPAPAFFFFPFAWLPKTSQKHRERAQLVFVLWLNFPHFLTELRKMSKLGVRHIS